MANFLQFGRGSILGVDIGTTSIKVAEIVQDKKEPRLKNYGILETYGHLERANSALQTSSLKIMTDEAAALLKALLEKAKFSTNETIASLPAFSVFTTLLEIPEMSNDDLSKTIQFQIKQHIPLPITEVTIDWLKVGERENEEGFKQQQILLISVPNEQISRYQSIFKLAGLRLKALEVESLALVRSLMINDKTPALIVDIGSRSTNILVADGGLLKHNAQSDFAGISLTQAISSGLEINMKRAEELKKQKGVIARAGEYELSTLIFPFLDAIINEARRAKENYEKNSGSKIEKLILTGGGANLLGVEDYIEKQLGLKTAIGNPFSLVRYPTAIRPVIKELGTELGAAVGLALKDLVAS